ncbi:hypothetical protein E2C01_094823 [Portunus trituberculatus]|uniref:Uncharacterized protein n=1 Tax=Portunus trituberculatus TaxID=210409 RepID=A0A5B7JRH1_PORTR|nr:hypothetical protein [Portunus trituberculatus]
MAVQNHTPPSFFWRRPPHGRVGSLRQLQPSQLRNPIFRSCVPERLTVYKRQIASRAAAATILQKPTKVFFPFRSDSLRCSSNNCINIVWETQPADSGGGGGTRVTEQRSETTRRGRLTARDSNKGQEQGITTGTSKGQQGTAE